MKPLRRRRVAIALWLPPDRRPPTQASGGVVRCRAGLPPAGPGGRDRRQQPDVRARRRGRRTARSRATRISTRSGRSTRTRSYHWASITKTFTGIAIMQLRDRGLLSLDDPVVKYVPELRRGPQPVRRHLAGHDPPPDDAQRRASRADLAVGRRPAVASVRADALGAARRDVAVHASCNSAPGTKYSYSNPGVIFLGRIIELLSGDDYEVYITKNIFMPLGMTRSFFDRAPYHLRRRTDRTATCARTTA